MTLTLTTIDIIQSLTNIDQTHIQPEADFPEELIISPPRDAAVLIPLFMIDDQWNVLFIQRTHTLAEHSGQVAFPGGRASRGDTSPEMTALREAHEEIGLKPEDVKILGKLQPFLTITNYRVTPIIAQIPWPYKFSPPNEEVDSIFYIPLSWLQNPLNRETKNRNLPDPFPPIPVTYYKPYQGYILWGASARFTLAFLNLLDKK